MKIAIGTRSLLWGAHQVLLHPLFVALAWHRLYRRWPRSPAVWLAFICHDWGYWGKADLDGDEGETHPIAGALILHALFDAPCRRDWHDFSAGHSRSFARRIGITTSALMAADKLATVLMPLPLYVALVWLSGEWLEYRGRWVASGKYPGRPDDGVWTWARHLRGNWRRFGRVDAVAGKAYGGE